MSIPPCKYDRFLEFHDGTRAVVSRFAVRKLEAT